MECMIASSVIHEGHLEAGLTKHRKQPRLREGVDSNQVPHSRFPNLR